MRDRHQKAIGRAWRAFHAAMRRAPPGARFEVGASFNKVHGWRPYYRFGARDPVLLAPAVAFGLVSLVSGFKALPPRRLAPADMARLLGELQRAASDCETKNKSGEIVLPGMVAAQPN